MVKKRDKSFKTGKSNKESVKADIIILGCSLPGLVAAHKLRKKFGNTMDIMILDIAGLKKEYSKGNVAFQNDNDEETLIEYALEGTELIDNVARFYLNMYAKDFNVPLPNAIIAPERLKQQLNKLFQYKDGTTAQCSKDFHDFEYLSLLEKFELNQYQTHLDQCMWELFRTNDVDNINEKKKLLYFDQTNMEKHICQYLFFSNSKEIMRTIVRLVCGVPADTVSVLFYLHLCYRTRSTRNHLDGDNTRFREKLLGYCRKHLANKLQQSIADITLLAKPIKEIRSYSDEQVVLETIKGGTNYVCNLLAMAVRPDELLEIQVEKSLLTGKEVDLASTMIPGRIKKFQIQYEEHFWRNGGYSGDILSIKGPIVWAMERPKMSSTDSLECYSTLIGFLMVSEQNKENSKEDVIEQLVKLFGENAATPVSYRETIISDIFVPRCGDYVALRRLTSGEVVKNLEWGALDIFVDGDLAAALEAGHKAYLHLLSCLRPQAQTYEDVSKAERITTFSANPFARWLAQVNYRTGLRWTVYTAAILVGIQILRSYVRK